MCISDRPQKPQGQPLRSWGNTEAVVALVACGSPDPGWVLWLEENPCAGMGRSIVPLGGFVGGGNIGIRKRFLGRVEIPNPFPPHKIIGNLVEQSLHKNTFSGPPFSAKEVGQDLRGPRARPQASKMGCEVWNTNVGASKTMQDPLVNAPNGAIRLSLIHI